MYAPVADNEWLFNRFGADMLVVNGVDTQTQLSRDRPVIQLDGQQRRGQALDVCVTCCF